jgi:hypothetical protein
LFTGANESISDFMDGSTYKEDYLEDPLMNQDPRNLIVTLAADGVCIYGDNNYSVTPVALTCMNYHPGLRYGLGLVWKLAYLDR